MRRLALAVLLVAAVGCKKKSDGGQAPPTPETPRIPAAEIKRGEDACKAYIASVCACTAAPAVEACKLAQALPDALRVGIEVATSPDASKRDVVQANDSVRKTIKECIELTAKLPSLGC